MSRSAAEAVGIIAKQRSQGLGLGITEKAEPVVTTRPIPRIEQPARKAWASAPATPGPLRTVGGFTVKTKPLWPSETAALDDTSKEPHRDPYVLSESDWQALAETEVTRKMTFDSFLRHSCLLPLVKGHDPDYAAAARLYLEKKAKAYDVHKE